MFSLRALVYTLVLTVIVNLAPVIPRLATAAGSAEGSANAPTQQTGSAAGRPARVPTSGTDERPGGVVDPPAVPGAVPPQRTYSNARVAAQPTPERAEPLTQDAQQGTGVSADSAEILGARQAIQTEYTNPDGTHTLRFYASEANVRDKSGALVPRDLRLKQESGRLVPAASNVATSFAATATDPVVALVPVGLHSVGFGIDDAAPIHGETSSDNVATVFKDVRPKADLRLTASPDGVKEELVLSAADAPTSWAFPLALHGLTPSLDKDSGAVVLKDDGGAVQARFPVGWMVDSKLDPVTGEGATSNGVTYALEQRRDQWVLQVTLDQVWLRDPARQFPVVVDPTVVRVNADPDDTYVMSPGNVDHSTEQEVKVGHSTDGSGGHNAAAYIDFNSVLNSIRDKYVVAATVNVVETSSYSCTPSPVTMYPVTASWAGSTMRTWPGAAYDRDKGTTLKFAHGNGPACPVAREGFPVDLDLMTQWAHGKTAVHGFTFRASTTDNNSWKAFASAQSPVSANIPYLDVTYSPEGAAYAIPNPVFDPPITNTQAGSLNVVVRNWGSTTWPANGAWKLTFRVMQGTKVVVGPGTYRYSPSVTIPPGSDGPFKITVPPLPPGLYELWLDMGNASGQFYSSTYNVPFGKAPFSVNNVPPAVTANQPASGALVPSLTPTLYAESEDPDKSPPGNAPKYDFKICGGTPDVALVENVIRAGQAAWYSLRMPPKRGCRRMLSRVMWSWLAIGDGSGRSGRVLAMPWWGRWLL
jgi:hypothetical protein